MPAIVEQFSEPLALMWKKPAGLGVALRIPNVILSVSDVEISTDNNWG